MSSLKRQNLFLVLMAIGIFLFDQLTKLYVIDTQPFISHPNFTITPIENFGIIFGLLEDTHPFVRIIFFSLIFILITMSYFIIDYLFLDNVKLFKLRLSLTLFFSAVAGNALERINSGSVTDFIQIQIFHFKTYFINFADIFQLIGLMMSIYYLFKLKDLVWNLTSKRKNFIINPKFQYQIARFLVLTTLAVGVLVGALAYCYLSIHMDQESSVYQSFFLTWIILMAVIIVIVFILGLYLSNRIAGPLYGFERYLERLDSSENDIPQFKIRKKDYFNQLETMANKVAMIKKNPDKNK